MSPEECRQANIETITGLLDLAEFHFPMQPEVRAEIVLDFLEAAGRNLPLDLAADVVASRWELT